MATKQDKVQMVLEVDTSQGVNRLGKMEMVAQDLKNSMARLKQETKAYQKAQGNLDKLLPAMDRQQKRITSSEKVLQDLRTSMQGLAQDTEAYSKKSERLQRVTANLEKQRSKMAEMEGQASELRTEMDRLQSKPGRMETFERAYSRVTEKIKEQREEMGVLGMTTKQLRKQQADLKREMDNLTPGTEKYKKLEGQLVAVRGRLGELRGALGSHQKDLFDTRQEIDMTNMSLRDMKRLQKQLADEIEGMPRSAAGFEQVKKKYQGVTKEVGKQEKAIRGKKGVWKSLGSEVKQFGVLAAGYLGFQEALGQMQNLIRANAQLSDSIADVQKTTGMTKREVEALNKTFKTFNTRTSRRELLELAKIAGKLGVQGRKNIEGFVKAADQIVVALGEDLGGNAEDTIRQVGKLVDVFKVDDEFGLENGLIKVGSAINSLGAASTANEGYLVDFAKRLGGIAPNANISIDQVLGLAATMDQLGQTSEVSSTAIGQLLVSFAQDIPSFAKLAGVSVQEFSRILEEDANTALIKVLEGAKSTQGGLSGMAQTLTKLGVDGARAASVVGVLSNNTDLLRKQQKLANKEFKDGTSLSKEFALKNNTLGAAVEKLQKALAGLFISPAFIQVLEKAVTGLERFINKNRDLSDGLRGQQKQLIKTQERFNAEMRVLQRGSLSVENRRRLVKRMNEQYKEFLPSLLTEKTTTEELVKIQDKANEALMRKILLKAKEAAITEKLNQLANLEKENIEAKNTLLEAQITAEEILAKPRKRSASTGIDYKAQEALRNLRLLREGIKSREKEISKIRESINEEDKLYEKVAKRLGLLEQGKITKDPDTNTNTNTNTPTGTPTPDTVDTDFNDRLQESMKAAMAEEEEEIDLPIPTGDELDKAIAEWRAFKDEVESINDELHMNKLSQEATEILRTESKYEQLQNRALAFYEKGKISETEYLEEMLRIRELYEQELSEKEKQAAEARKKADLKEKQEALKREVELWNAKSQMLSQFSGLISATNELIATQGAKQSNFQKQLALAKIAVDTASAVSSAIAGATSAAASTGPGAPFVLAGYIASMVASVFAGVAKAKTAISDANTPAVPEFLEGGHTGGPIDLKDSKGLKIAGVVHPDEYVVPTPLLGNPMVADMVGIIESLRLRKGFYAGSQPQKQSAPPAPQPAPAPYQRESPYEKALSEGIGRMNQTLDRLEQEGLKAYFNRKEAQDSDEYLQEIENYKRESSI